MTSALKCFVCVRAVAITVLLLTVGVVQRAWACHPCIIYEVRNSCSEITDFSGDKVPRAKIRVFNAIRLDETGSQLSCLAVFKKGSLVQKVRSDAQGRFELRHLPRGEYFVVIKAPNNQVVTMISISDQPLQSDCSSPQDFGVSESGFVGNMCDVLQAKDFF